MAVDPAATQADGQPDQAPDESDLESSKARLQELHVALRSLRDTIPRLMEPMTTAQITPETLYSAFSQTARRAGVEVKYFTDLMRTEKTKTILDTARRRKDAGPDDVGYWKVEEDADWFIDGARSKDIALDEIEALVQAQAEAQAQAQGQLPLPSASTTTILRPSSSQFDASQYTNEKVKEHVDKHIKEHSEIRAIWNGDERKLKYQLPSNSKLRFEVKIPETEEDAKSFRVEAFPRSELSNKVGNLIQEEGPIEKVADFLEKLYSYKDLRERKCSKCDNLNDQNDQVPVLRVLSEVKSKGGTSIQFQARHTTCVS